MQTLEKPAVKSRGILFSESMVKALLAGTKTQTRRDKGLRQINQNPDEWYQARIQTNPANGASIYTFIDNDGEAEEIICPYGKVGDRLYVKETWAPGDEKDPPEFVWYRADKTMRNIDGKAMDTYAMAEPKWKSSMFMPRILSRITLEITEIRCERLSDISADDARAEGISIPNAGPMSDLAAIDHYALLWNKINGPDAWHLNPWIFAITFRRIANQEPTQ